MWQAEVRVDLGAIRANVARAARGAPRRGDGRGQGRRLRARPGPGRPRGRSRGGATWLGAAPSTRRSRCARPASPRRGAGLAARPGAPLADGVARRRRPLGARAPGRWTRSVAAARADRPPARRAPQGRHRPRRAAGPPGRLAGAVRRRREGRGRRRRRGGRRSGATSPTPTRPATRPPTGSRGVRTRRWRTAEGAGLRPEVRHLANSAATLTAPGRPLRPGAARHRRLRPLAGARSRPADFGLRPAMTLAARLVLVKRVPAGQRRVATATPTRPTAETTAGAGAAGVRRRRAARREQHRPGAGRRARGAPSPAGSAWTSSWSTAATTRPPPATRSCCSAPATTASRPRRTGPRRPARSPTRSSPGSGPGCRASTSTSGRACPVSRRDRRAGLGQAGRRRRAVRPASSPPAPRSAWRPSGRRRPVAPQRPRPRTAPSRSASCAARSCRSPRRRVRLHVEVDGPAAGAGVRPVTVVFCHGLALDQDSWHFQRRDLADSPTTAGGWSSGTSAATAVRPGRRRARHHRPARPRPLRRHQGDRTQGPVVLVGHSMGGMTIMALAEQHPELFGEAGGRRWPSSRRLPGGWPRSRFGVPAAAGRALRRVAPKALAALNRRPALVPAAARWARTSSSAHQALLVRHRRPAVAGAVRRRGCTTRHRWT